MRIAALVFVLLCALTNFMAKTVDFVELIQGVQMNVQIYPGVLIVVVLLLSLLLFHIYRIERKEIRSRAN